jgi:hypothetical protein
MDDEPVLNGFVPIDNPTNNPEVARQRRAIKQSKWRIDMAIDQGQIEPGIDDEKKPENVIIIPDNRNSV